MPAITLFLFPCAPLPPNLAPACATAAPQPTATFTGPKVCGKTWTFALKAKNGAGLWSELSAPTETSGAAPCPLKCLPKAATCQAPPGPGRRLFGTLTCCNGLKCVAAQVQVIDAPFVCASKPSAPFGVNVLVDQNDPNAATVVILPPDDAGAWNVGERMGRRLVGPWDTA